MEIYEGSRTITLSPNSLRTIYSAPVEDDALTTTGYVGSNTIVLSPASIRTIFSGYAEGSATTLAGLSGITLTGQSIRTIFSGYVENYTETGSEIFKTVSLDLLLLPHYAKIANFLRSHSGTLVLSAKRVYGIFKRVTLTLSAFERDLLVIWLKFNATITLFAGTLANYASTIYTYGSTKINYIGLIPDSAAKFFIQKRFNTVTLTLSAFSRSIEVLLRKFYVTLTLTAGGLRKSIFNVLGATIYLSEYMNQYIQIYISNSITLSALSQKTARLTRNVSIALFVARLTLTKKLLQASIALSGSESQFYQFIGEVAFLLTADITKFPRTIYEGTINLAGELSKTFGRIFSVTATLSGSIIKSIALTAKNVTLNLSGGIQQFYYLIAGVTLILVASFRKTFGRIFNVTINLSGSIKQAYSLIAKVTLTLTGKVIKSILTAAKQVTLIISGGIHQDIYVVLEATLILSAKVIRGIIRGATITLSALFGLVKNPVRMIPRIIYFFVNKQPKVESLDINKKPKILK
jgi:hypothetical protein